MAAAAGTFPIYAGHPAPERVQPEVIFFESLKIDQDENWIFQQVSAVARGQPSPPICWFRIAMRTLVREQIGRHF